MIKFTVVKSEYVSVTSQRKMNRVFADLFEQPKKFNMRDWGQSIVKGKWEKLFKEEYGYRPTKNSSFVLAQKPPCGTVACLAGQCLITLGGLKPLKLAKKSGDFLFEFDNDTPAKASDLLGMEDSQTYNIFYPGSWPESFRYQEKKIRPGTKKYLTNAYKRWQHFVKTGE